MKRVFRLFRRLSAFAGFLCLFGAIGTDEMYTDMGQMPPESVEKAIVWGFVLLIPTALHYLKGEARKKVR